jgi:hypothetical protein
MPSDRWQTTEQMLDTCKQIIYFTNQIKSSITRNKALLDGDDCVRHDVSSKLADIEDQLDTIAVAAEQDFNDHLDDEEGEQ